MKIQNADINLVRLPDELSFEAAASLGCRFITAYRALVDQAKLDKDQFVAVHGCGGVGLSAIMIAKAKGAKVVAIEIQKAALDKAKELGADHCIDANSESDLLYRLKTLTNGGVHVSLDAIGSQETCFNSIANLKKRGKHIQVGLMTEDHKHPVVPMDQVIANELEIIGSHGMQAHKYPEMFELIHKSNLILENLIPNELD